MKSLLAYSSGIFAMDFVSLRFSLQEIFVLVSKLVRGYYTLHRAATERGKYGDVDFLA